MNAAVEVMAYMLGFLGWIMVGIALPNRYWKVSTVDGSVITTATIYENLWMSCATDSTGVHNCREFPSLLALSGYIQASRALMIVSIVMGALGLVSGIVGLQCTKLGGDNYVLKGRLAGLGGVFFLLQGLCTMISVSWYAFNITKEFFDPFYPGTKYEIGDGLYIGWSSALLAICGGVCLLCACKMETEEKVLSLSPLSPGSSGYPYQPYRGTVVSGSAAHRDAPSQYDTVVGQDISRRPALS
ncbi:CLD15 protein, partial [Atractosteus spatula]|nr:CLD15 protein [Atractosteus spatula]